MKATKLDERFFESTRGRVLGLLCGKSGTVTELAEALGLTDNAVRAHLLSLEDVLREVGRSLAGRHATGDGSADLEARLRNALGF